MQGKVRRINKLKNRHIKSQPPTRGIKYWGLMGNENESLAGKVFNVGKIDVNGFPNISYRQR